MRPRDARWLALTLTAVLGCRAARIELARARAWTKMRDSQIRWYPLAWGTPMDGARVHAAHRRFDCIWDAMTQVERDPREDVACMTRQIDYVIACAPRGSSRVEECLARSHAVCAISTDYVRAAQTCAASDRSRLW
jgi:hypothetical protein